MQRNNLTRVLALKAIWLRVGNGPTAAVAALLRARVADVLAFAADPVLALLVLP